MATPNPQRRETVFTIHTEFITLGQLLKATDFVSSGAEVKDALVQGGFIVNDEPDNRRGRKLRPGDIVTYPNGSKVKIEG